MSGGDTLDHMLSCVADIPGKSNYGVLLYGSDHVLIICL